MDERHSHFFQRCFRRKNALYAIVCRRVRSNQATSRSGFVWLCLALPCDRVKVLREGNMPVSIEPAAIESCGDILLDTEQVMWLAEISAEPSTPRFCRKGRSSRRTCSSTCSSSTTSSTRRTRSGLAMPRCRSTARSSASGGFSGRGTPSGLRGERSSIGRPPLPAGNWKGAPARCPRSMTRSWKRSPQRAQFCAGQRRQWRSSNANPRWCLRSTRYLSASWLSC